MSDSYTSPIAETISASGNFINNVKQPLFILTLVLLAFLGFVGYYGGILAYKYLDALNQQKDLTQKIVDLQQQTIALNQDEKKLMQALVDLQLQNIDAITFVKREVHKNNMLVEKGNQIMSVLDK